MSCNATRRASVSIAWKSSRAPSPIRRSASALTSAVSVVSSPPTIFSGAPDPPASNCASHKRVLTSTNSRVRRCIGSDGTPRSAPRSGAPRAAQWTGTGSCRGPRGSPTSTAHVQGLLSARSGSGVCRTGGSATTATLGAALRHGPVPGAVRLGAGSTLGAHPGCLGMTLSPACLYCMQTEILPYPNSFSKSQKSDVHPARCASLLGGRLGGHRRARLAPESSLAYEWSTASRRDGTLMRHFLWTDPRAALAAVATLALGMTVPAASRLLISPPRRTQRFTPSEVAAACPAVLLAPITA